MNAPHRPYVYLDLGFYGPCNLKCTYCRSDVVRDSGATSLESLHRILDSFGARHRAAVAKMSGYGEITIWPHFSAALDLMVDRFPAVQVITNGAFGRHALDAILDRPTVSPNLTIDGHTMAMNRLRVEGQESVHTRILDNLKRLSDGGKRVEINCVLHEQNIRALPSFCEYLADQYAGRVMLFPFPARSFSLAPGIGRDVAAHLADSLDVLEALGTTHGAVLPPAPYMDELCAFIRQGARRTPCYVHWLNAGCGPRMERLFCANYGEDLAYGPMDSLAPAHEDTIAAHESAHFAAGRVGPRCDDCFNHFHILGMFLDGRITLEDLTQVPSLSFDGVKDILLEVRQLFEAVALAVSPPATAVTTSAIDRSSA